MFAHCICVLIGADRCGCRDMRLGKMCRGISPGIGVIGVGVRCLPRLPGYAWDVIGGMMMDQMQYPCEGCCRVPDPAACNNKECSPWRCWFLQRWEQTRRQWQGE